jgi:hypothetical protein
LADRVHRITDTKPVAFPAHALVILEERLRERQAQGELPIEADVTELALKMLVVTELTAARAPHTYT